LAFLTFVLFQRWFFGPKNTDQGADQTQSGQSFIAPKSKLEERPLNKEVDFIDEKRLSPRVLTDVETDLATYVFSTDAASLNRLEYKGDVNGNLAGLATVFPVSDTEREDRCFLVALDKKTPYFYNFLGKKENEYVVELNYRYDSPNSDFIVDKKFSVYKKTYKIDLLVEITPKKALKESYEARLFFPAPVMPALGKNDQMAAVVINEKGNMDRTLRGSLNDLQGWRMPRLFGADNKYFAHAMIDDPEQFAQRAYYKVIGENKMFSILEGPQEKEKKSWTTSFYFGPKEEQALVAVDKRLVKFIEYSGWFAPIANPISKLLMLILRFLYKYLKNYGWAIIILTLIIRLIMLPFTIKAEKSMKQRLEFQKKLEYLQKKYKHDKSALARERAELIKKHGMPGLGGCLPLLFQLPIFIALSNLLRSSIELYKAPFILWIKDLSAPDPYYVLPILMSVSMLAQAFTADPKSRFMMIAMALVIGPLFASMPAGLGLYIVASVGLGVLQTFLVKKLKTT
ncbi:YidC/Oxa1 family insertase periplasmic-domain containing protein, partial [Candidatus Dependentiae bacterium]